jgi:PilZ domain
MSGRCSKRDSPDEKLHVRSRLKKEMRYFREKATICRIFSVNVPIGEWDTTTRHGRAIIRRNWVIMRKFDYRTPRFAIDLPVRLTLLESTLFGRCTEISTEGMRLEVSEPLSVDAGGAVHVTFQNVSLDLPVRVAHCGAGCEGVQFVYGSDEERDEVIRFIALLAAAPHRPGPVLLR